MCCLKYEQEAYESLLRITPKTGAVVTTPEGKGTVTDVSLLTGVVKVRLDKSPDSPPVAFHREQIKVIRDNRIKVAKEEQEKAPGAGGGKISRERKSESSFDFPGKNS